MSLSDSANLCVDDTKESGKAFWTLVNFNSSPAIISLSIRVNGLLWAGYKTAANLPDAAQQSHLFRLCRVWLRPGFTGMLVRCMLRGAGFVVSAPKHKRKHSPTRLPDCLGNHLHMKCNAVPLQSIWRLTSAGRWLRRMDLNHRPPAYETGELPLLHSVMLGILTSCP